MIELINIACDRLLRRPRRFLSRAGAVLATGLILPITPAAAGAWTLAEDAGLLIATTTRTVAPFSTMWNGAAERDSNTAQFFIEYGIVDGVTGGLKIYSDYTATTNRLEARLGGHARVRLWTGETGDVVSTQLGASFPINGWFGSTLGPVPPDSVAEVDLRVLYGRGWQRDWGDSFVSSELGFRWRAEKPDDELLFDVTMGFRPFKRLMGLVGLFSSVPLGERGTETFKLAPSLAYTLWPSIRTNDKKPTDMRPPSTLQLGVTWDAASPGDGLGVTFGVWKRF